MNCKKIRDLIITDYLDQEAADAVQKEVQAHLKVCAGCRGFEQALREKVSVPLRAVEPAVPPESVWRRIQEAIEEEQVQQGVPVFRRVFDFLAGTVFKPKPVVALSAALAIIIVSLLFLRGPFYRQWIVKDYLREQSASMSLSTNGELEKDIGFGTAIENIFFGELS